MVPCPKEKLPVKTVADEVIFNAALDELERGALALVVFEDMHWVDEATLDLLKFLGRRIDRARAMLVVTEGCSEEVDAVLRNPGADPTTRIPALTALAQIRFAGASQTVSGQWW
jgi:hypothetical protein